LFAPPRSLDRSKVGEGRQALTGAVLRVLAPLDGSGCRTRHARTLADPPSPWRPDASRPCFVPLAPLESPFRAFPSRGAVPALAGLLLPCGFAFDQPNGAARTELFAIPFPVASTSRRGSPVRAGRTRRPGRRFPGTTRTLSVARCRARFSAPTSRNDRARRIRRPTRPLRSFAPLESPFPSTTATLARGRSSGRCSPGLLVARAPDELPRRADAFPRRRHPASLPARRIHGLRPSTLAHTNDPLEFSPAARRFGLRAGERGPGRTRLLTRPRELDSWPHVRQARAPVVGPRTHDPPT